MTFRMNNVRAGRLTPEQVVKIRELYDTGMTQRELCWRYNVSIMTIGRIVRGESWKHYGGPGVHPGANRLPTAVHQDWDAQDTMMDQGLRDGPILSEAEVAASVARLREMGIEPKQVPADGASADPRGSGIEAETSTTGEGK